MKKLLLLVLLTSSSIFAQKLTKEQLTDKMSDVGCECASKQEITKDNMELTLGLCILEAMNKYEKDVEKHYGKNVITDDKKMEQLGYDIGLKMGTIFPELVSPYFPGQSMEEINFIEKTNEIGKGCNKCC